MATRRADPHHSSGDAGWDFSFVGAPRQRSVAGLAPPDPAGGEAEQPEWDFSFAGPRIDRTSGQTAAEATDQVEQSWDFSFAGERIDRSATGTTVASGVEADTEWDFSFVAGARAAVDTRSDDEVTWLAPGVDERQVGDDIDDESNEWPQPAKTGEMSAIDTTSVEAEAVSGDVVVPVVVDVDATEELPRDELSLIDTAPPTEPVAVVEPQPVTAPTSPASASTSSSNSPLKILTVCTHNRTRSVMAMAMLQAAFDRQLGPGKVIVRSLGFGPEGEPAIDDAVDEMTNRGLDVVDHQSLQVTADRIGPADLILCAEKQHVIKIAEIDADAFRRTFTLPEFCSLVAGDPVPGQRTIREWMHSMSTARTPARYLSINVPEVADPTGAPKREFAQATRAIEAMCDAVADVISVAV